MNEVPKKLADKLSKRLSPNTNSEQHDSVVKQALEEVFCELDRDCPDGEHGGCTASVILQLGHKLFVANTGDSRSFICVHRTKAGSTEIVYTTRDHKPGVPEERARVESMGGKVWIANGPGCAARVLFTDPLTGLQTGLAMSRSIGDRDVGKYGVIPNPTVDVIDLREIIQKRVLDMNLIPSVGFDEHNDPVFQDCIDEDKKVLIDDVHIFAVSASDGMMDVLEPKSIARLLVPSLCHENGEHLLTACEKLVSTAAKGWQQASEDGGYRDDIAISVSKIRTPPCT
jgi:serine/threonine protein phosphatase PrpC